jgi:hypothetical protein
MSSISKRYKVQVTEISVQGFLVFLEEGEPDHNMDQVFQISYKVKEIVS